MGCVITTSHHPSKPQPHPQPPRHQQRLERPFCFLVAKIVEGQYRVLLYDVTNEKYICALDDAHLQLPIWTQTVSNGDVVFLQMDRFCLYKWSLTKHNAIEKAQITYAPVREPAICMCHRLVSIPFRDEKQFMLHRKSHLDPTPRIEVMDYDFHVKATFFGDYAFVSKVSHSKEGYITLRYERYIGLNTVLHERTEFVTIDQKINRVRTILSHNTSIHSDCCSQHVCRDGTLIQTFRNGYIMFLQCDDWAQFTLEHAPFPERLDQAFPCFAQNGRRLLDIGGFTRHNLRNNQQTTWVYIDSPSGKPIVELENGVIVIPTQHAVFVWFPSGACSLHSRSSIRLDIICMNIFVLSNNRFVTFSDAWTATTWMVHNNKVESLGSHQLKSFLYAIVQPPACDAQLWTWTQQALDEFIPIRDLQRIVFAFLC